MMPTITNQDNIAAWGAFGAEQIAAFGDEGDASRRYVLNPVLWDLLGDVRGKQILDAGCGTGYLCRMLAAQGAQVTGVEPADTLFRYAVQRETTDPQGIRYVQHDLSTLDRFTDLFDAVIANMVLMDIPLYEAAIRNCIAALKPGGQFIVSLLHPCFDEIPSAEVAQGYGAKGYIRIDEYFREFAVQQDYGHFIHRPLGAYVNLMIRNGCIIRRLVEPMLTAEGIAALGPHNRNMHVPAFVVIGASKTE